MTPLPSASGSRRLIAALIWRAVQISKAAQYAMESADQIITFAPTMLREWLTAHGADMVDLLDIHPDVLRQWLQGAEHENTRTT